MDTKSLFKKAVNLLTLVSFLMWDLSVAAPEGGSVAQGSAAISQSGTVTTVNQTSQNAVINWQSFNTASNEAVKFNQPNSNAVALNRINNGLPTQFAGQLSANGNVWILNPAGVLFTSTARVDVAGLLATTHNITDANFMMGNYKFDLVHGFENASVINNGLISAKDSGLVALVAPHVENNGLIQVNFGRVALASGASYTLDMYGDNLINFGSSAPVDNGSVSNAGQIIANGGKVYMTANAAAGVLDNVISMSGTVQATSVTNGPHGEIILNGGHAGRVKVSGKLDTSPKDGFVETSGAYVDLDPNAIINAYDWLLDPLTINLSSYGSTVQNILNAGTNVTLSTGVSALTSGTGNITIDQTLTWSGAAVLTLAANHNITISNNITATSGGGIVLHADFGGTAGGTVNFTGGAKINVSGPATIYYYPGTTPGTANYSAPTNFNANFLGTLPTVYMAIDSTADLATLASQSLLAGVNSSNYNLANNVTYSGTGAIFPNDASFIGFAGIFDGHNYVTGTDSTISGFNITGGAGTLSLTFNNWPAQSLFTGTNTGTIKNLNLSGNITNNSGFQVVGAVAAENDGTISHVSYTGTVNTNSQVLLMQGSMVGILNGGTLSYDTFSGTVHDSGGLGAFGSSIGGLVGLSQSGGQIQFSSVAAGSSIIGSQQMEGVGGLVGSGDPTISNSYNQGNITGLTRHSGGIVGAASGGTYTNVYNSGLVTGSTFGASDNGGILGRDFGSSVQSGTYYNSTNCPACSSSFGGSPLTTAQMQVQSNFVGYNFANIWVMSGSSPFFPVLQSTANTISTNTVLGTGSLSLGAIQSIAVYINGVLSSTVTSNGTGAFAFIYSPDLFGTETILATTNSSLPGAILNKINVTGPSFISGLNITLGQVTVNNSAGVGTFSNSDLIVASGPTTPYTVSGNNITLTAGTAFVTTAAAPYVLNGNISVSSSGGDITFGGTVTLASNAILSSDFGNVTFNNTINGNGSGPWDLTINDNTAGGNPPPTGPGVVTFNGIVGGSNPLNSLTVDSSFGIVMNTSAISTVGNQSYNPNVIFSPTVYLYSPVLNLTGSNINFNNSSVINHNLSNPNALTITGNMAAAQQAAFRTTTGGFGFVGSLHVTGTSLLGGGVGTQNTQTYDGNVTLTTVGSAFFSSDNTDIIFNNTLKGNGSNTLNFFTLNGATTFNGQVGIVGNGSPLSISNLAIHANTININTPNIYTNASQTYTGAVSVLQDATLTSYTSGPTFSTSASTINSSGAAHDLTITATSGTAEFDGAVGVIQALKDLVVNAFAITLKTSQINTTLNQNYTGAMTINNVGLITFTGSNVQFNSPVDSSGTPAQIQIDGNFVMANTASIGQSSNVAQLAVLNGNSASIRGNITTTGDTDFSGPVVLTANTSITDSGTGIYFHSTVDSDAFGPWSLTLNAAPTTVQFEDVVGSVPLSNLTITATDINFQFGVTGVTTTGDQTYNASDLMDVFAFTTFAGNNITVNAPLEPVFNDVFDAAGILWFKNTIDFGGLLTAIGNNYVQFDGMIGFFGAMQDIDVTGGSIKINTNYINTSNNQDYHSPVVLMTDAFFPRGLVAGGTITFESTLNGPHDLYLQANTINFNGIVGTSAPNYLNDLLISGSNQININTTNMNVNFAMNFDNPVNILQDTQLQAVSSFGAGVSFGDRVEGPNALTVLVPNGDVSFWNNVGSQTPLSSLSVTARNVVGASDEGIIFNLASNLSVTTTGSQTYNGMISFADVQFITFQGTSVTFNGPADSYDQSTQIRVGTFGNPTDLFISSAGIGQLAANSGNVEVTNIAVYGVTTSAGNVTTVFDQNYFGGYTLTQNNILLSDSGSISFGNYLGANGARDLTISAVNGIVEFDTPNVPVQGLRNLDVTAGNIDINGSVITTTGSQHYHNFTIFNNGLSTLTAGTVVIFDSFLAGPGGLSVSSVGPITFSNAVGAGPALDSLEVAASLININTGFVHTTNMQEYHNNVLINNVGAMDFTGSNVQFDAPVNSTGTPAQITITGGLTLANTGSIGQSSDVSSLTVTGPSSLRNAITTTGDPIFGGAVILTGDTTVTDLSVNGITFQSTIDSDAFGPWSLTLNAPIGPVELDGDVGNSAALHNLIIQNATEVDLNTPANPIFNIITTGVQTYVGDLVFSVNGLANSVVQYYLTAGGDITVNNQITAPGALNSGLDLFINSSGNVFLKDNVLLNPANTISSNAGGYLDVTAGGNIYLGTFGGLGSMLIQTANVATPTSGTTQSLIFRSPIVLDQDVTFNMSGAAGVFDGTIDSDYINHPGSAFSVAFTGSSYFLNINAPMGSLGELQSVSSDANNFGVNVATQSQDNNLFPGIPNFSVTTVADQTYLTSMFMYVAFGGTVLFKSDTGTVTFTETDSLHALAVSGGCVFACPTTFNGNVVLNGDAIIHGSLLALNGSVTLNNAMIMTDASQEYDGTLILNGANNVLNATNINQTSASNIYFAPGSSIDGQGNNLTLTLFQTGPSNSYRDTAIFDNTMTSAIGTLSVTADKVTQSAGGALTATNLATNTNEGMDLSQGTNQIQNFSATNGTGVANQSEGDINLTNTASPLNITSITQNGNNIFVSNDVNIINTGAINIAGPIVSPVVNNTVFLTTNLNITQSGAGTITSDILNTSSVTGTNLTTATNTVNSFAASNTVSGDIDFTDAVSILTLIGITQTGGNVTITNSGDINIFNNINALGEIVNLISTTGGIPQGFGGVNADTLNTSTVTGSDVTGTVNNYGGTNTTSGNINFTNNQTLNITGINQTGGNLGVLAFGSINQSGAISVTGFSGFTTFNGSIDLVTNGSSNNFQGPVSLQTLSSGNAKIFNNGNLNLAASNIAGDLTSVSVPSGDVITLSGNITTAGSQTYNNPVIVNPQFSNTLGLVSGTGILFTSTIDDVASGTNNLLFQGTSGSAIVTVNGDIGGTTPLAAMYVQGSVPAFDFNGTLIHTVQFQVFWNNLVLSQPNVTLQNDNTQSFDSYGIFINTGITGASTNLDINGDVYFGEDSGNFINVSLASLVVDAGMFAILTDGTTITTSGAQTYNGKILLENNNTQGPVTLVATPGSVITFNDVVINDDWNNFTSSASDLVINADLHVKADIGPVSIPSNPFIPTGRNGTLNSLAVTGNVINFNSAVTQVNTFQAQTYTGTGINPLLTVNADPSFSAGSFSIAVPVLINANTTYTSTAGNIDFQQAITGDGVSSLILFPTGGSAIFENTVGTNVAPLGSLMVNGTSIFNQGSAQNVYTNGDQVYVGTSEIDNNVSLEALTTGLIALGTDSAGFFDNPSNSFHLNAVTHNASYGATGQGITGHVNVGSFTVGGEGGANVSPISKDSVVAAGSGDQAFVNWLISPEIADTYYCINSAAGCGAKPTPEFFNVPPVEIFNINPPVACDAAGCSNVETMIDNLVEAGVVECGGMSGCAFGFATAEDTNGKVRILVPGSVVYVGDKIMKDKDACVCVKSLYKKEKACMGPKDQRGEVKA